MDVQYLRDEWIGERVISVSNAFQHDPSDESLAVGTVLDLVPITNSGSLAPLVRYDGDVEPKIGMSMTLKHSDELWAVLKKLTPKERWVFAHGVIYRFDATNYGDS